MRHLLAQPLRCLNRAARLLTGGQRGLRILLLHDTPEASLPALDALAGWLKAEGRLVGPEQAERWLAGERAGLPADPCLISFDDGFASNLAAARVLERHGTRGLFFVCPALMALPPAAQRAAIAANIFDGSRTEGQLPAAMRLMDWDEVAGLATAGHAIGNHTQNHRRLSLLSEAELEEEIGGAAAVLARHCPNQVRWFAFPFGDIDSVTAQALAVAGRHHPFCRSGVRGANAAATHPLALRADHVDLDHPPAYVRLVAEGGLDLRYREARARLDAMASRV